MRSPGMYDSHAVPYTQSPPASQGFPNMAFFCPTYHGGDSYTLPTGLLALTCNHMAIV